MRRSEAWAAFSRNFFSLNIAQGADRAKWMLIFSGLLWIILSGLEILIHFFYRDQRSLFIVVFSFFKYLPVMIVPLFAARQGASEYLADIFELQNPEIAERFITSLAFGAGFEHITIDEARIFVEDINSTILHIGGPGVIHVNLDNAALTEKTNGQPHILTARPIPWILEGFERLREIGIDADSAQYQFAIIDLKDQFVKDLSVSTRTKDGIPIRADDIKIIFSVKRKTDSEGSEEQIHSVSEEAVHAIVYKQTVLVGAAKASHQVGFPWDSTILPLVLGELESLIMQSSLSEILASIGQKEMDQTNESEKQINRLKSELTGQQRPAPHAAEAPGFQSRSRITARFYEPAFQRKAEELGVQLLWIDIGTWKLPSTIILDKHKEAWNLAGQNAAKKAGIQHKKEAARRKELMKLINDVIFSQFDQAPLKELIKLKPNDVDLKKLLEKKPEDIATDILRAFRKELLVAQYMLDSKKEKYERDKTTAEAMQNAIKEITYFTEK